MKVDFTDYFWGDKNNGFDVLYHNMKYGLVASKEFAEFLRERSNIEENNSKLLAKLAKQAGSSCVQGTFAPVWQVLRTSAEKLANIHLQMVQKVSELVKEVNKYAEELHKKHKTVKEEESSTLDIVLAIQNTASTLQKAKDTYTQKGLEFDKLKKENASPKDLEKAEVKLKKSQEDYKILVDKYSAIKVEFENKMSLACKHFQDVEEAHLKQMKEFLGTYAEVLQNNHELIGQVHIEFKRQCLEMTVDKLLEQFVLNKYTGLEKPGSFVFEEVNISGFTSNSNQTMETSDKTSVGEKPSKKEGNLECGAQKTKESKPSRRTTSLLNLFMSHPQGSKEAGSVPTSAPTSPTAGGPESPPNDQANALTRNPLRGSKWFLRSRRDKRNKDKKSKKKKDGTDNSSNKEEKSDLKNASVDDSREEKDDSHKSETPTPEVDDEGYCIRPKPTDSWENDKASFYSTSDSDSDDDRERKIHVEIKPLSNGAAPISASVDELRATVENLSLSPVTMTSGRKSSTTESDHQIKRSQSVSQQLGCSTVSNASTPTVSHPYAPLQSPTQPSVGSPALSSRYADLGDLFSEVGEIQPAVPAKSSRQTPTPTQGGSIVIPRPPSRRGEGTTRGRVSPAPIYRADSVGSLEFRTAGVLVGSSRGPSPLTIGMSDTIPLAVAFHEIVHSYFKGTDETKCQVKISGDMMVSFPAGIVAVLANNPNPALLSFRIKNMHRLENVLPNKQLVTMESISNDICLFEFNMSALTALLRKQSEQNPSASYFNVDILKYQIKSKSGAGSCPFQLVAYWKCETNQTDLKIDYKYNSHAMTSASPLLNVMVAVPVDGGVKNVQSRPPAQWLAESNRAIWKFTELSQHSENHGVGSLRARFEITNGPSNQGTIATQFNCEGTTLSGLEFELVGSGYRLSLVKRRFVSGKYICDGDPDSKYRYAIPPSSEC